MSVYRFNSLRQFPRKPRLARFLSGLLLTIGFLLQRSAAGSRPNLLPRTSGLSRLCFPQESSPGGPLRWRCLASMDGLASDVALELGGGQRVTTDATGRASFTAPSAGSVLIAKGSGSSAAALVDANPPENPKDAIWAPAVASLHEPFSICGSRFRSDADANHVRLNGEPALVMAASPECLSVMPGPKAVPVPRRFRSRRASGQWTAQTTLVSLEPQFPSRLYCRAKRAG